MGRSPCCYKVGLKKGPWTPEEDQKLLTYIQQHGHGSWRALPPKAGLERCGKSCRLRWTNYLRPDIKRGKFTLQEEQTIIQLHALLGNRWSAIATHLPKRTDNEIKNYWNTHLKKRLTKMGIDPVTHRPKSHYDVLESSQPKDVANLSHIAQWESVRVEAESRLQVNLGSRLFVSSSNTNTSNYHFKATAPPVLALPPRPPPYCLDILKVWQGRSLFESPNSIFFNFSDNMIINVPTFGLVHENSFVKNINSVKPTLDNSLDQVFNNTTTITDYATYNNDSINNYPGFMEGFTDTPPTVNCDQNLLVGGCSTAGGVFEDNKTTNYCWNNINVSTNFVTSPMGSPVF